MRACSERVVLFARLNELLEHQVAQLPIEGYGGDIDDDEEEEEEEEEDAPPLEGYGGDFDEELPLEGYYGGDIDEEEEGEEDDDEDEQGEQ